MKKVLSSKGVFEISDSLYENIKKNNPELLMEDIWDHTGSNDSGMNLFIINSLVDDIFKNEKNKNKRSINAIKQKVESIYKNKERNSLNVLDAFDDAKDYLNKVKKEYDNFKSMKDDEQRNNQTQTQTQRNNQTQSNEEKLNNVEQVFEASVRNNINKIINEPNMPDEYINECIKRYKNDLLEKYPNGFFKKDKKNIIRDINEINEEVKEDCRELLKYIKMFNNSSDFPDPPRPTVSDSETVRINNNEETQEEIDDDSDPFSSPYPGSSSGYEVVPQRERELVYAESFKMPLKKLLKEDDEDFNLDDLNNENNRIENLDQLFLIFSKYGIEEVKKILGNNIDEENNNDFDMDIDDFDDILNDNKMTEKEFKKILSKKYSELFGENPENTINACERVIGSMKKKYGKDDYKSTFPNNKKRIKQWYDAVNKEIDDFKKYLKELEKNGILTESSIRKSRKELFKLFAQGGMKKVLKNSRDLRDEFEPKNEWNGELDDAKIKEMDEDCLDFIESEKWVSDDPSKVFDFFRPFLKDVGMNQEQIDRTLKRYLKKYRDFIPSDNVQISSDEWILRAKNEMKKAYYNIKKDCKKLKEYINKINHNNNHDNEGE